MKNNFLFEILEKSNDDYLVSENYKISKNELLKSAREVRSQHANLNGLNIVLSELSTIDFIKSIIAFHGIVRNIYILQPESSSKLLSDLDISKEVEFHHIFNKNLSSKLKKANPKKINKYETQFIFMTSGTTGKPKNIFHSFNSLTEKIKVNNLDFKIRWGLVYEHTRFAAMQVILQSLLSKSVLIIPDDFSFNSITKALLINRATHISATPTMWKKFLLDGKLKKLDLKQITLGGEIAHQSLLNNLKKSFSKARITHIYASTEAGAGFSVKDNMEGFPAKWLTDGTDQCELYIDKNNHLFIKINSKRRVMKLQKGLIKMDLLTQKI